ncbi:transposase [Enterocloster sp. OA13]|uniref:hypothetical protein n=1 Tax=Enterocloster sp. OA13 TaxID=2914161 RepID=UPI0004716BF0|nr:transposase [Enterocloster sp. OA13]
MGQKDISLVRYFDDRARYADLINGFIFCGEQVVSEDDVQEMDSNVTGVFGKLRNRFMVQKYRDCVRKIIFDTGFAIVGIENQDKVHYAMPARIMLEDAAGYDKQLRQIRKRHRRKRDLRDAEYVGGFAKQDKVYPVVTICIYFGKEPYDGAKELFHMMDYETLPDRFRGILNNYKIQVLELRNFGDIDCFRTDLREVFGFIKHSNDKKSEWEFAIQNEDAFKCLDEDAFDVIVSVTGSAELEQVKDMYCEEGGKINMCEAIRGMIEDGRIEGVKQGLEQGIGQGLSALVEVCREFGLSKEDVVSKAKEKFSLSMDEMEDLIDRYWNQ